MKHFHHSKHFIIKKHLLILFASVLLASSGTIAQPYIFSQYTSAYSPISGTVISVSGWDDFSVFPMKLPFTFHYFDSNFDSLFVMGGFAGFTYDGAGTFGDYEIAYYMAELIDRGSSTISHQVTGSTPNRIFKLQNSDAGFAGDGSGNDYANVQLWFYETSNIIEMHYGASSVVDPQSWPLSICQGPQVVIAQTNLIYVSLSGPASNPVASSTTGSYCVTGAPPSGKVYKFVPNANGVNDLDRKISIAISPNPSNGMFTISSDTYLKEKMDISIVNCLGEIVHSSSGSFSGKSLTMNVDLQPGIYFVRLTSEQGIVTRKIILH